MFGPLGNSPPFCAPKLDPSTGCRARLAVATLSGTAGVGWRDTSRAPRDRRKASINELMSVLGSVGPWMLLEDLARPPGRRVRAVSDEESTGCYGVLRPAPLVGRFCARQGGPSPSEVGLR